LKPASDRASSERRPMTQAAIDITEPKPLHRRYLAFGLAGSVLLFGAMAITCVDVIGRYFINRPLPGGFELTEVVMATLIFLGMPLVTAQDEHIKVDVLELVVTKRVRMWQAAFGDLVAGGTSALIGWALWTKAGQVAGYGDHTEVLKIPLTPVAYLMCLMMAFAAAIFLGRFARSIRIPRH
jgi:TRAP-type C4-dicarboxylate transport system permease small subunit